MKHKCDGCKYKSTHQEMGFKPFGVCRKGFDLIEAQKNYNAEKCPYEKETKQSDCLTISVDFSPYDNDTLMVMRHGGEKICILNGFRNEEAIGIYKELIGEKKRLDMVRCGECKFWEDEVCLSPNGARGNYISNPNWFCASGVRK